MSFDRLFDPYALLLVVGGTILATLLRCGWAEIGNALRMVAALFRSGFSERRVRGPLAIQAQQINAEGLLRANLVDIPDRELADGIAAVFQRRSVDILGHHHSMARIERERVAGDGVRVLNLAADLSPVFGLAGTLVALSQLPAAGLAPEAISGAVSSAVLTTLYGVLSANLFYAPLARQVARCAEREEQARQAVIDWFMSQIAVGAPIHAHAPAPAQRHARVKSA